VVHRKAEIVPLVIPPDAAEGGVQMEVKGTHSLIFRDEGPWGDRPVSEILIACSKYVEEHVIPRFKPFFR
jgi:hypothetical protein